MGPRATTAAVETGRHTEWLSIYKLDVVTLLLTTLLALKFWWVFLGLHDPLLLGVAVIASMAEIARRIVVARREWRRPETFGTDRRFDLFAGILLATGPWPIADLPVTVPLSAIGASMAIPAWFRVAALAAALAYAVQRLVTTVLSPARSRRPLRIRELTMVPDFHIATMVMLPSAPAPYPLT